MLQCVGRDLSSSEIYPPFLEGNKQGRKHWRNAAYGSVFWDFVINFETEEKAIPICFTLELCFTSNKSLFSANYFK